MKRLLSILLVATMMFTFMVPAAFAAGGPTASVTSASAKVGETVTVTISINGLNEAVTNAELKVSADSALTLIDLDPANLPGSVIANPTSGKVIFAHTDPVSVSTLAVATFRVDANAASGDYYVYATVSGMRNGQGQRVSVNSGVGKITVHGHAATGGWLNNATYHWHKCSCGQEMDKALHTPGPAATVDNPQVCTVCGYELAPKLPAPHTHVYGEWTYYSAAQHIRECSCGSKETGSHVLDENNKCTICLHQFDIIVPETPEDLDSLTAEELIFMMMLMGNRTNTITATAGEGGTITPAGATKVPFGRNQTYVITPMPGYEIDTVVVDGKDKGAISEYTFNRVLSKHTITATFKRIAWVNPFRDVKAADWFYSDVAYVNSVGLMIGTSSDEFSPMATATRAQIVMTLWRLEGQPVAKTNHSFTDVENGMWYTDAIAWAAENKIVDGYGDGIFAPDDAITREQIVAILHRYADYKGIAEEVSAENPSAYEYSEWAEKNVTWANENGIFAGIGMDITDLSEEATRAEIAAYLARFCLQILAK